ncbi:MAG: ABC transporter ATP-binding protein [Bacillota bacterium]|nr:ABC transporter ATP-binding protein [Bacillota bacterium]
MNVLSAVNLQKVYGGRDEANTTKALNGLNLKIESGEFIGVMGPSGSGKTTLLNILSGIDKPTSGTVEISGKNLIEMDNDQLAVFRRQKLGFVFQDFNLIDSLTIKENIILPLILDKRSPEQMEARANAVMSLFEIDGIADKYPYNVSGGQQQRTAVSRAIINHPDIVFADEPTGNLDSKSSTSVMKCLERMNTENNSTILMVTHDSFAASYCKKIIFIKDGTINMEIVRKGTRKEFFDRILDCLAVLGGERNDI